MICFIYYYLSMLHYFNFCMLATSHENVMYFLRNSNKMFLIEDLQDINLFLNK